MKKYILTTLMIFFLSSSYIQAQFFGENERLTGILDRDTYAAGGIVSSSARVNGDLVAAGGQINIGGEVLSDLTTAGGNTTISAKIGDDARIAGGQIQILSPVGGDLLVAGGQITISPDVRIGGRFFAAGGMIDFSGTADEDANIAAGTLLISGHFKGNLNVKCDRLVILDTAVIDGKLTYSSPNQLEQKAGAKVLGGIDYKKTEQKHDRGSGIPGIVMMFVTTSIFFFLFPGFSGTASQSLRREFLPSIGLGLLLLLCIPVVALFSMITIAGLWIGLALTALYLVLLLTGLVTGILFLSEWSASLLKADLQKKLWRILSILIISILAGIIQMIPLAGAVFTFLLMLAGTGSTGMELYKKYRAG